MGNAWPGTIDPLLLEFEGANKNLEELALLKDALDFAEVDTAGSSIRMGGKDSTLDVFAAVASFDSLLELTDATFLLELVARRLLLEATAV